MLNLAPLPCLIYESTEEVIIRSTNVRICVNRVVRGTLPAAVGERRVTIEYLIECRAYTARLTAKLLDR